MSMMLSRVERSWWWTIIPFIFAEDWIELMMTHKGYGMKRGMGEAIEGGEETAEKYFLGKLFFLLQ